MIVCLQKSWLAMRELTPCPLLQGRKTGMLLEYDPETSETRCLATGLWFANGVDVSTDGSYLVVGETFGAAIHKHWLTGPKV